MSSQKIPPFRGRHQIRPTKWNEERTKRLVELHIPGALYETTAKEIGVTPEAVSNQVYGTYVFIDGEWKKLNHAFPRTRRIWSDQNRVKRLKSALSIGKSRTEIALDFNTTRSAISGAVFRLGLRKWPSATPAPSKNKGRPDTAKHVDQIPRDYACKFPIGDPRDKGFHFCNARVEGNGPYCPHHAAIAYRPYVRRAT